jgi:Rha family phage regulatory protein
MTIEQFKPRVLSVSGVPMTTSIAIAEHFGKNHQHVMEAVRNEISNQLDTSFTDQHFQLSSRNNSRGQSQPMYRLTETGFSFIAMGFTGATASRWKRAYVETFFAMRNALQSQTAGKVLKLTKQIEFERQAFSESLVDQNVKIYMLEAMHTCGPKEEYDNRMVVFNAMFKMRKDLVEERLTKTRYVTDQGRISSAETALRLAYALNPSEAAILWLLMQAGAARDEINVSVEGLLRYLRPHIKCEGTVRAARSRLVERGLIAIQRHSSPNRAPSYIVFADKVLKLLTDYDAHWLQADRVDAAGFPNPVPGLTDAFGTVSGNKWNYDFLVPKTPAELVQRLSHGGNLHTPSRDWPETHAVHTYMTKKQEDEARIAMKKEAAKIVELIAGVADASKSVINKAIEQAKKGVV